MTVSVEALERLIGEGRFLEARARAAELSAQAHSPRAVQLLALSMGKSGAPKAAMDLLEPLHRQHPYDPETCGILGSLYKALFRETKVPRYAVLSRDTYFSNYRLTGSYYTGINAASMYAISGSMSKAKEIARELVARLAASSSGAWELATLGEASLLLRDNDRALEYYLRCRALIGADWGTVGSIFNQLWLLNHYIPVSSQVMAIFSPPAVVAFVGHMIDRPGRTLSRFPPSVEGQVKQAIAGAIQSINAKIGYCSLACGGDILFAEAMAEGGGEVNLFLPFAEEDFIDSSVAFAGGSWLQRFRTLSEKFPVTYLTAEGYGGNDELFSLQSQVIFGAAVQRAERLHSRPHLITVNAETDIRSQEGGTYETIRFWPETEKRININPQHYMTAPPPASERTPTEGGNKVRIRVPNRHVRFLVCVAVGDASAEQRQRAEYQLAKKMADSGVDEVARRGDAVLLAFRTIGEATALAWGVLKLPGCGGLMKVSLHAGPVYVEEKEPRISGSSADIARAVNEFSVPGRVYSSFQFASVLALQGGDYALEYAGIISVGGQGLAVFQVNRHAEAFDVV